MYTFAHALKDICARSGRSRRIAAASTTTRSTNGPTNGPHRHLPAAERGHERLGGHRAAHLQGAPQDGILRLGEPTGGGGACWGGDGARESVVPARREGGPLGGELGGGGGWCRGREDRVGRGGGVLESRGGDEGGEANAMAAAGGGVGGAELEVEAEMGVRESGGHWSGVEWSGGALSTLPLWLGAMVPRE